MGSENLFYTSALIKFFHEEDVSREVTKKAGSLLTLPKE
jgi:hypothetical protein